MVGEQPAEPSIEVQNLRSDAQKDALGGRRTVWRVTTNVEHEGETKGNEQQVAFVREYFVKAEAELPEDHDGILALMDGRLTLSASTGEPKVFYYKTDDPVPRVMEESLDVERLKFQRSEREHSPGRQQAVFQAGWYLRRPGARVERDTRTQRRRIGGYSSYQQVAERLG